MRQFALAFILFFTIALNLNSLSAQSISGIINQYARVNTIDICEAKLTVANVNGLTMGTRIILIQMNGATIRESNNDNFGQITDLKNTGKYEVNFVDSIAGNNLYLRFYLKNEYDVSSALQVVSYPSYNNAIVIDTLRAKPWDGAIGGILAFEANTLTLNAPIIATGTGFRGGLVKAYDDCQPFENYNNYYYPLNSTSRSNGAPKGEGIAAVIAEKECGRGPQANGGGGGNNHKTGGGGGGHISSGGGGGFLNRVSIIRNCAGDFPGWGGTPVGTTETSRLFFGGGGGAGHNRTNTNNSGGAGGGIIIIKVNAIATNSKLIAANGAIGRENSGDGSGGGGAGGTLIFSANQITGSLQLQVKGGNGGNSNGQGDYDFGPGGGGSGGRIILSNSSPIPIDVTGGLAGKNIISRTTQGASNGENGQSQNIANFTLPMSTDTVYRTLRIVQQPIPIQICEYQTTIFKVHAQGVNISYEWQINRGNGFVPLVGDATFIGTGTSELIVNRARTNLNPYLFRCVITAGCGATSSVNSVSVGINILPLPIPFFSAQITYNTVSFTNTTSNGQSFKWFFGDGRVSSARDTTIVYAQQGTYEVMLRAINNCDTVDYSTTVVLNSPPKASFTANVTEPCVPSFVQYTNTSSNNTTTFRWSFPGGSPSTSTEKSPSVLYTTAGIFATELVVVNTYGRDTMTLQNYIRVGSAPIANFRKNQNGNNPTISFDNLTVGATSYRWDFGDGDTSIMATPPPHTYRVSGEYIIKLIARNHCGETFIQDTVRLQPRPSAIISVSQQNICTSTGVRYTGQNPTNVTTWAWSFPGGTPSTSNQPNPIVFYNQAGSYDVTLKVSNGIDINETTLNNFIKVLPSPRASFDFLVDSVFVTFTNTSSNADSYAWNFGDGTTRTTNSLLPFSKTYNRNNNYPVTLQALNAHCGAATSRQVTIFVTATQNLGDTEGVVTAYPNPSSGSFTLKFDIPLTTDFHLQIATPDGRQVKTQSLSREQNQEVNISEFSSGIYFLHFVSEKTRFVKRILKL